MRYLLNSAVLAAGAYGEYSYSPATVADLAEFVAAPGWLSRIGYPETAAIIAGWTGVAVAVSREMSAMEPGDVAMIVRLRYRVADPTTKGAPTSARPEDWEIAKLERRT